MANAFDQFDNTQAKAPDVSAAQTSAAPTQGANPFDQFDGSSGANSDSSAPSSSDATIGGVAKQTGLGVLLGIPHAIAGTADMLEKGTADALTFSDPKTGENQFHQLARNLGIIRGDAPTEDDSYQPTTGNDLRGIGNAVLDKAGVTVPEPQNRPERIARAGGEGASLMLAPELMAGKLGVLGSVARAGTVGTSAGVSSQAAAEVVPEKYKPLASLVGGLVGGMAGEGVTAIPSVVKSGVRAAKDYAAPLTEGGREGMAGSALRDAATDPDAALDAITNAPRSLVPGSEPTTFQLTGDAGLGTLERATATKNPAQFQALRGDQNSARLDALSNIQADGHPEAVSGFFRDQMSQIDKATQLAHDGAEYAAQQQASGLGGGKTPEAYGEDIKSAVNPQIDAAATTARTAAEGLGGGQPEVLGEQARNAVQARLDALKTQERALWSAVDPDGKLMAVASPIKQATQRLYGDIGPETEIGMAPVEKSIAGVINDYGAVLPFQRLINLRSAISQAMRDVRSPLQANEPAYGRLSQLRGAVEDAISDSVAHKVATEQQAVAEGALQPQETTVQRWAKQANEIVANAKLSSSRRATESGPDFGETFSGGPEVSSGDVGAGSQTSGKARGSQESPGDQGNYVDQEAADRLKSATQATASRKQTFGAKPVSQILQRPGTTQPYTMSPANVTSNIWKSGNAGADTVRSTLQAAGNSPEAIGTVRNMAAASLREKAADGIITPKILSQWRGQHAPALSALEQAAPGSIARFENAARASEGLARFDNFNPQTASGVLPERYFATGDKGLASVDDLRSLIGKDRADKLLGDYAADSLRKSAARPDGTIDPKKFEAWQKAHSGALRALPDVDARFSSAARASDRLATVAADRKDKLEAYQKSAAGKLLKVDDPNDVVRTVGSLFGRNDSVQQMRSLAHEAAHSPDAMTGLRRAIVEHMESKLISNTEAATTGRNLLKADAFQTFLGKNFTALRQVFSDSELNSMRAIAQDLKRANRSIASSKLPGQSNTAQDLAAMQANNLGSSLLGKIFTHVVGTGAGFLGGAGPIGAAAGFLGSHVLVGMREAGIRNVEDLIRDAMLNPDLAKSLMMKAPKRAGTGSELTLGSRLRGLAMFSAVNSNDKSRPQ